MNGGSNMTGGSKMIGGSKMNGGGHETGGSIIDQRKYDFVVIKMYGIRIFYSRITHSLK